MYYNYSVATWFITNYVATQILKAAPEHQL